MKSFAFTFAFAAVQAQQELTDANDISPPCFRWLMGRGPGAAPTYCDPSTEVNDEGLCYPQCPANYSSVDGDVTRCRENCPSGYKDEGYYCGKPSKPSYERYATKSCKGDTVNCEEVAGLWYPKCSAGYRAIDCCTCSAECPDGFSDSGVSCKKPIYFRGPGKVPTCTPGLDYDAGLCYTACPNGYIGHAENCFGGCDAGFKTCTDFLCIDNSDGCTKYLEWEVKHPAIDIGTMMAGHRPGVEVNIADYLQSRGIETDILQCPDVGTTFWVDPALQ